MLLFGSYTSLLSNAERYLWVLTLPTMTSLSLLAPIDPSSIQEAEQEKSAPWIIRKLVGVCLSLYSRLILAPLICSLLVDDWQNCHVFVWIAESYRHKCYLSITGAHSSLERWRSCLIGRIQWGDSSPLLLPCIRFRDLAVHTVIAATGGMAAVAAPVMGPVTVSIMHEDWIKVHRMTDVGWSWNQDAAFASFGEQWIFF